MFEVSRRPRLVGRIVAPNATPQQFRETIQPSAELPLLVTAAVVVGISVGRGSTDGLVVMVGAPTVAGGLVRVPVRRVSVRVPAVGPVPAGGV